MKMLSMIIAWSAAARTTIVGSMFVFSPDRASNVHPETKALLFSSSWSPPLNVQLEADAPLLRLPISLSPDVMYELVMRQNPSNEIPLQNVLEWVSMRMLVNDEKLELLPTTFWCAIAGARLTGTNPMSIWTFETRALNESSESPLEKFAASPPFPGAVMCTLFMYSSRFALVL